jgi:hypothetical protein
MISCWEEGYWDYALDGACTDYGGCTFVQVCKAINPDDWLPVNFEQRVWDPLARAETTVAEYERSWGHVREGGEVAAAGEVASTPQDGAALGDELAGMMGR